MQEGLLFLFAIYILVESSSKTFPTSSFLEQFRKLSIRYMLFGIDCWADYHFRTSCRCLIPFQCFLSAHVMQPGNQVMANITRQHSQQEHNHSNDRSRRNTKFSIIIQIHLPKKTEMTTQWITCNISKVVTRWQFEQTGCKDKQHGWIAELWMTSFSTWKDMSKTNVVEQTDSENSH